MSTISDPKPLVWTREVFQRAGEAGIFGDLRVELVEGQVIEMTPAGSRHINTIGKISEALRVAFGPEYLIRSQATLDLHECSQPEPDVSVMRGGLDDFEEHHPTTADLVVEVSESTIRYDRNTKAKIYATARLPEYWIVNLDADQVEVFRQPDDNGAYAVKFIVKRGDKLAPLAVSNSMIEVEKLLPTKPKSSFGV